LIARELGVSPKTVEKHRSNLMRKLQLHNAAAITMFAIRNGMTGSAPLSSSSPPLSNRMPARPQGLPTLRSLASTG
jgi:Bacterial regulatory proteins, luxR family